MKTVEAKIKQQYGNLYRVEILCFSVQGSSGCYYSGSSINDKFPFLAVHDGIFHFPVQRDVIISCINVINKRSTVYILNKSRNKKNTFFKIPTCYVQQFIGKISWSSMFAHKIESIRWCLTTLIFVSFQAVYCFVSFYYFYYSFWFYTIWFLSKFNIFASIRTSWGCQFLLK